MDTVEWDGGFGSKAPILRKVKNIEVTSHIDGHMVNVGNVSWDE